MYKRYGKKMACFSLLMISIFIFISEVFAATSTRYTFVGDGTTISVQSDSKLKGNVGLKASRDIYTRYYNGTFRFVLYKKNIFGNFKEYGRVMRSTYNDCNIVEIWGDCPSAYYKGTLQLYAADTTGQYSGITTNFDIYQNN